MAQGLVLDLSQNPDDGTVMRATLNERRTFMKTGKPRLSVGCLQNGPQHDVGLRWFVCERDATGALRAVAPR